MALDNERPFYIIILSFRSCHVRRRTRGPPSPPPSINFQSGVTALAALLDPLRHSLPAVPLKLQRLLELPAEQ
jgi:hypothetical protein